MGKKKKHYPNTVNLAGLAPDRKPVERGVMSNQVELRSLVNGRLLVAGLIAAVLLLGVLSRYWYLQVWQYDKFAARSDNNRIRLRALPPTRGLIFDRNGIIVADNRPAYRLEIVRERLADDLDSVLNQLAGSIDLSGNTLEVFERRLKDEHRAFEPVVLRYNLTEQEVARIAVDRHALPGVEVTPYLTRYYPFTTLLAHVVGYVGRIDESDLQQLPEENYRATTHIGKSGLERFYENRLHGTSGYEKVETNVVGRLVDVLESQPPVAGENLNLTIDVQLQRHATLALGQVPGAVLAMVPQTGEILAMVSNPSFDPNAFINGISQNDYNQLLSSPQAPFLNRVLQGEYVPGSTLKPFVALVALNNRLVDAEKQFFSSGEFFLEGSTRGYRDARRGGYGWVSLQQGLEQSVNTVFYQLALELGIDRMHQGLGAFGFGRATGIDLQGERTGVLPSRQWKQARFNEPWYPGETVIAGIGQGYNVVTPLQLTVATAILATKGQMMTPHLWQGAPRTSSPPLNFPEQHWQLVLQGMRDVIHGDRGTATAIANENYEMAGKTGTAQVFSRKEGEDSIDASELAIELHNHALFIAFAPLEAPEIVVVSVVEHGGSGSRAAAPVAATVIGDWLQRNPARVVIQADDQAANIPSGPATSETVAQGHSQ